MTSGGKRENAGRPRKKRGEKLVGHTIRMHPRQWEAVAACGRECGLNRSQAVARIIAGAVAPHLARIAPSTP